MLYEDFLEDVPVPLNDMFKMLEKSGVLLKVKLVAPEYDPAVIVNGKEVELSYKNLIKYLKDPETFAAGYFGISIEQYREWFWSRGVVRCAAKTSLGLQCRNEILHHGQPLDRWLTAKHERKFCLRHKETGEKYDGPGEPYPPVVQSNVMAYLDRINRANPGM